MNLLSQFDPSPLRKCTAVLFVLAMIAFGFVQAVHVHDARAGQESSPTSHCSSCVAAHQSAVITPVATAPLPVVNASVPDVAQPQFESQLRIGTSFIRPPPQSL